MRITRIDAEALTPQQRTSLRVAAGMGKENRYPIEIVDGSCSPEHCGSGWKWTTRGGKEIAYPSAYSRVGWSNMVYLPSTNRIRVGMDWLAKWLSK